MSKQVSPARVAANRRNAQKSTGPKTAAGKSRSSRNAITHGLLAENSSVAEPPAPGSPAVQLLLRFAADLRPVGLLETALVDRLAGLQQRLDRIRNIELGLFDNAITSVLQYDPKYAHACQQTIDDSFAAPAATLLAEAYGRQSRTLNLLSFYEARLSRDFHRTLAELRQSQSLRRVSESGVPTHAHSTQPAASSSASLDIAQTSPAAAVKNEQTNPNSAHPVPLQSFTNPPSIPSTSTGPTPTTTIHPPPPADLPC